MSKKRPDADDATETQQPVITKERAQELVLEGRELRREYRRHIDAMWNISAEQLRIRTR